MAEVGPNQVTTLRMGSEWDFVKGGALLRVSGTLKPSAAGLYGANFGGRQVNQSVPSSP